MYQGISNWSVWHSGGDWGSRFRKGEGKGRSGMKNRYRGYRNILGGKGKGSEEEIVGVRSERMALMCASAYLGWPSSVLAKLGSECHGPLVTWGNMSSAITVEHFHREKQF